LFRSRAESYLVPSLDATSIKRVPPATDEKYAGLRCGRYFCPKSRSVSTDARMRCSIWLLMVITARHLSLCFQGFVLALAFPVALHFQTLPFTHFRLQPGID